MYLMMGGGSRVEHRNRKDWRDARAKTGAEMIFRLLARLLHSAGYHSAL